MQEHGARNNSRMGLNTWAAFAGTDADAMVAGDVAMLEHEVTAVLKALRSQGLNVVAIHNHMTGVQPTVVFLHCYGTGPAEKLATGVRAAVVGRVRWSVALPPPHEVAAGYFTPATTNNTLDPNTGMPPIVGIVDEYRALRLWLDSEVHFRVDTACNGGLLPLHGGRSRRAGVPCVRSTRDCGPAADGQSRAG